MISFNKKPISISPDYRPLFKISQIVLVLKICSTKETASLLKLHLFSWALRSSTNMEKIIQLVELGIKKELIIWSIEPSLNRALAFSVAEKICVRIDGKFQLSEKGQLLYSSIMSQESLFSNEKEFLLRIKKKLSESRIENIFEIGG